MLEKRVDVCFYCVFDSSSKKTFGYFGMDIVVTIWLFWAYLVRLFALYFLERRSLVRPRGLREIPPDDHYNLVRRIHEACNDNSNFAEFRKYVYSRVYFAWFAYLELRHSYWWEILWLLSAGAFSLTKVLAVWLSYSEISRSRVLAEASTEMGFGQMAALLLLMIPCLAALEAFNICKLQSQFFNQFNPIKSHN